MFQTTNQTFGKYIYSCFRRYQPISDFFGGAPPVPPSYPPKKSRTGHCYTSPSEKYQFVSWDDDYSQLNGKIKVVFQSPPTIYIYIYIDR